MAANINKIVLAYSGGLDTSVILKWLKEEYQCPVIAYAADVGQEEDWDKVREKGMATGAEKVVISDLKEEFVRDYVFPAFRANAIYEGSYLLGTSLARPIIAKEQVRIVEEENADAVSAQDQRVSRHGGDLPRRRRGQPHPNGGTDIPACFG